VFDTYEGIPEHQMSEREKPLRCPENARMDGDCFDRARENFRSFPNAQCLSKGLSQTRCRTRLSTASVTFPLIVVLDDYAWQGYEEQKAAMDDFAATVKVEILTLPTWQGIIIKP
jgi:hypothetical protein